MRVLHTPYITYVIFTRADTTFEKKMISEGDTGKRELQL